MRRPSLTAVFAPSEERHLETTAQGRAFLDATRAPWPTPARSALAVWDGAVALPVAVAVAGAGHDIALASTYPHALASSRLGQADCQRVLAALEPVVAATAGRSLATQHKRLFRS